MRRTKRYIFGLKISLIFIILSLGSIIGKQLGAEVESIYIVAEKYKFTPDVIKLYKGEEVELNILAADVSHGFCCKAFSIYLEIPAGEEITYRFTPDKVGEFEFYCCVYCGIGHKKMKGKFIIEAPNKGVKK